MESVFLEEIGIAIKILKITDELIEESVTKPSSDALSDAAEIESIVDGEGTDINIMSTKKSEEEVLEEVDIDDEAEISDMILDVIKRT
ncbi:hypothetical protein JTB14_033012 [Gonioctena quinquepunctata]|nr:hypothetical protein JTB14_033012 [Gonioctena quinquepunctata]